MKKCEGCPPAAFALRIWVERTGTLFLDLAYTLTRVPSGIKENLFPSDDSLHHVVKFPLFCFYVGLSPFDNSTFNPDVVFATGAAFPIAAHEFPLQAVIAIVTLIFTTAVAA